MLNNLYELPYTFVDSNTFATKFLFSSPGVKNNGGTSLESYELIFNSPLDVGNGNLMTNYFVLTAQKAQINIIFSEAFPIIIIFLAYLVANFTTLGQYFIEFAQIFILLRFQSAIRSTLYQGLAKYLILLTPVGELQGPPSIEQCLICLGVPLSIITAIGASGYVMKYCLKNTKSIPRGILRDFFAYNFFLTISSILLFSCLFNVCCFLSYLNAGYFPEASAGKAVCNFLVYFGIAATCFRVYLCVMVVNPKINQSEESWQKYLKST